MKECLLPERMSYLLVLVSTYKVNGAQKEGHEAKSL